MMDENENENVQVLMTADLVDARGNFWKSSCTKNVKQKLSALLEEWVVTTQWGPEGKEGHKTVRRFAMSSKATNYFCRRRDDKLAKGYVARIAGQPLPMLPPSIEELNVEWDLL
ncbi:WGR domain-containing protein [bacterium]|nr:WGR domain-containing protein [bacterium]